MVDVSTNRIKTSMPTNTVITVYHQLLTYKGTGTFEGELFTTSGNSITSYDSPLNPSEYAKATRPVAIYKRFIIPCWVEMSTATLMKKYKSLSDVSASIVIPNGELKYLTDYKYDNLDDVTGYYSLTAGKDRVILGEFLDEIDTTKDLIKNRNFNVMLLTDVQEMCSPSGLISIEAGLK